MARVFLTGTSGFIGGAFVRRAVGAGHQVSALARSERSAERARVAGADPVPGDLEQAGRWQETAAAADAVVHLAQPDTYGARVTAGRARAYRERRLRMDALLLGCLRPQTVQRILYIAGTSYYGDQGTAPVDEDSPPNPTGWGPYIAPAIERLPELVRQGLPLVQVYPGWVYGPGSWFLEYVLEPLRAGKRLTRLAGRSRIVSPVHLEDAARALLHLLEHGLPGRRYFVVDDRPVPSLTLSEVAARTMGVPLRTRDVPRWLCRLALGPIIAESLSCDAWLSNAHLRETGFTFDYPTVEEGVPAVVARWQGQSPA